MERNNREVSHPDSTSSPEPLRETLPFACNPDPSVCVRLSPLHVCLSLLCQCPSSVCAVFSWLCTCLLFLAVNTCALSVYVILFASWCGSRCLFPFSSFAWYVTVSRVYVCLLFFCVCTWASERVNLASEWIPLCSWLAYHLPLWVCLLMPFVGTLPAASVGTLFPSVLCVHSLHVVKPACLHPIMESGRGGAVSPARVWSLVCFPGVLP